MINAVDISGMLVVDAQSVDKLRLQARTDPHQALKGAARQFEALFMNMLLKGMREATPKDGMFDSEQTRFYTSMLDQQLAQNLSSKGVGLADIMIRQLSRPASTAASEAISRAGVANARLPQAGESHANDPAVPDLQPSSAPAAEPAPNTAPVPQRGAFAPEVLQNATSEDRFFRSGLTAFRAAMIDEPLFENLSAKALDNLNRQLARAVDPEAPPPAAYVANTGLAAQSGAVVPPSARDFVNKIGPHARAASEATGISAHFVIAQAALESGWGKHEIRRADGSQSFNLFGIKAGRSWSGSVVEAVTTEYMNGVAQRTVERFRAYGSYAEGFRDYANLLRGNPRYAAVLEQQDAAGFARGLQRAGYATDPLYADKLTRILNGNTLRQSLMLRA